MNVGVKSSKEFMRMKGFLPCAIWPFCFGTTPKSIEIITISFLMLCEQIQEVQSVISRLLIVSGLLAIFSGAQSRN